jgi:nicotinate-nucleotide adenylyltransferase
VIGLLGGAFDPPHNGHVALADAAKRQFAFDDFLVLVSAHPGHKRVVLDAQTRLSLARLAFPHDRVVLDEHARTIDSLRAGNWSDPLFLIGADEFCDFLGWKDPESVLQLARLGVATRPGYPREKLDAVLERLREPDRVLFFEIDPWPVASRELRERLERGESVDGFVPAPVAEAIRESGLYRSYTATESDKDLTTL